MPLLATAASMAEIPCSEPMRASSPTYRSPLNQPTTCVQESHQPATAALAEQLVSPFRNTLMGQQGRARVRKEKLWKLVHHGISHVGSLELCPGACAHRVLSCIAVISQGDQLPTHCVLYFHRDMISEGRQWCPETPWLLKQEQILVPLKLSLS